MDNGAPDPVIRAERALVRVLARLDAATLADLASEIEAAGEAIAAALDTLRARARARAIAPGAAVDPRLV